MQNTIKVYAQQLVTVAIVCLVYFAVSSTAAAQPTATINYQGKLTDSSGVAVADGTYNMRFWLLQNTSQATTAAAWTESLTGSNQVQVTNGLFSVMLGSTSALSGVDFNQPLYLGVEIGGTGTPAWDGEMLPRKPLGTVPAAFQAFELGGVASSSFLRSDTADRMDAFLAMTAGASTTDFVVTGTATTTNLVVGSDFISDLTGAGLIITGNALTVSSSSLNLALSGLTDVNLSGPVDGELMSYDGSQWVNVATNTLNLALSDTTGTLGATRGGTGLSSIATGDLLYGSSADTISALSAGTNGQILQLAAGVPTWAATSSLGFNESLFTDVGASTYLTSLTDNLAIGTTSPDAKLDVWGDFRVGTGTVGTFFVDASAGETDVRRERNLSNGDTLPISGQEALRVNDELIMAGGGSATNLSQTMRVSRRTTVAGGTLTTSGAVLDVTDDCVALSCVSSANVVRIEQDNTDNTGAALLVTSNTTNGGVIFQANDNGSNVDTTPFVIDQDGNTGIGTASPSSKLTVAGDTFIGDNLRATGTITFDALASGLLLADSSGLLSSVATSTLNIALSDTTGTLAATRGGTGLSTITENQLLIGGPGNTWTQIATSSLGLATGDTVITVAASDTDASIAANADYVADGTNDQDTIETALAALPAEGGRVQLLSGTFSINDTINLTATSTSLVGEGPSTILAITATSTTWDMVELESEGNSVRDLTIDGSAALAGNQDGIRLRSGRFLHVENVHVQNMRAYGIYVNITSLFGPDYESYTHIKNNTITNTGGSGIYIFEAGEPVQVVGNTVDSAGGHGIQAGNGYVYRITISENSVSSTTFDGIFVTDLYGSSVVNNNEVEVAGRHGIFIRNYSEAVVDGNYVADSAEYGINFIAEGVLSNNMVRDSGQHGIQADTYESVITGNSLLYNGGGVYESVSIEGYGTIVSNNVFSATGSAPLVELTGGHIELASNLYYSADLTEQSYVSSTASVRFNESNRRTIATQAEVGYNLFNITGSSSVALAQLTQAGSGDYLSILNGTGNSVLSVAANENVGIGTSTPTSKLTVDGDVFITGGLYDNSSSTGVSGYVLQSTGTGFAWVATSTLGIGGGSSVTFGTDNQIPFMNAGGTDFEYESGLTFDGTNLGLASGDGISFGGVRYFTADATSDSLSIGENAGSSFDISQHVIAIGTEAGGSAAATSTVSVFLGYQAGQFSSGNQNVSIGYRAGQYNENGGNVLIGDGAGRYQSGYTNVFLGEDAGERNQGTYNIGLGRLAGTWMDGNDNVSIGQFAGYGRIGVVEGGSNNAIGAFAGAYNAGSNNNLIGSYAGASNYGNFNDFIGFETGGQMNASATVAIGGLALRGGGGVIGSSNTATTTNNTVIGYGAGYNVLTGGDNNLLLGYQVADSLTTGANNIIIGYDVEAPSNTADGQLNIGNLLFGTGIDGTGTTLSSGSIGIGTSSPASKLDVWGDFRVGTSSSPTLFVDTNGSRVGVGTTTFESANTSLSVAPPGSGDTNLDVWFNNNNTASLSFRQIGGGDFWSLDVIDSGDRFSIYDPTFSEVFTIADGGNIGIGTTSPASKLDVWGDFRVGTSGTPTLFTDVSSGRVGVGTIAPSTLLEINANSDASASIISSDAGTAGIVFGDQSDEDRGGVQYDNSSDSLTLYTNNSFTRNITLNSNGDTTFGSGSGDSSLSINVSASDKVIVHTAGTGNYDELWFAPDTNITDSPTPLMVMKDDLVGIGTSSPTSKLTVDGDVFITGGLYDNSSSTGVSGYVLQSTGTGFAWVATSTLGIGGGSSVTFGTDNQIPFMNAGGTDFEYDSGFIFDGTNLDLASDNVGLAFQGTRMFYASSTSQSIAIGSSAGTDFEAFANVVAIGRSAALNASSTNSDDSVFIGFSAGSDNEGVENVFIGRLAGAINTGRRNIGLGKDAAGRNTGDFNFFVGSEAGEDNEGDNNIGFGSGVADRNEGNYNTFLGDFAGARNTGSYNNIFGVVAGDSNTGSYNNFLGYSAGYNNTGSYNNFLGYSAGYNNTGSYTEFIGFETGALMGATNTVAIGGLALRGGGGLVSSGLNATTTNNTVIGYGAGYNVLTGGDNNLLLGYQVADSLTTGANNIIIGYDVEAPSNTADGQLNIGNLLFGTDLDGTGTDLSSGNIGIGTTSPASTLDVWGDFRVGDTGTPDFFVDSAGNEVVLNSPLVMGATTRIEVNGTFNGKDGGPSSPSYQFSSGGNMGMYRAGNNRLAFSTDSTERLRIDEDGNVGIGTSSPLAKLSLVASANEPVLAIASSSGDSMFYIDEDGNVGIGTDAPSGGLEMISSNTAIFNRVRTNNGTSEGNALRLVRSYDGGVGGAGIGVNQDFYVETSTEGTEQLIAKIGAVATDATAGAIDSYFYINTRNNGIAGEALRIDNLGNVGIGTTSPNARLTLQTDTLDGAGIAGLSQYLTTENTVENAVQFGNYLELNASNTATTTIVGGIVRVADDTTFGNTVRGLEVQADRGGNTQGENTALSGFARTFGVRGVTSGDAGSSFEPAGGFFETEGTTQGNAIRGFSSSITTASLLSLFQDTSDFTGTGIEMNFGNTTGDFSSTSSKYLDFQNAGTSVFTVSAFGTTTIGDGTTNNMAGLQIGYGGICVDNDGSCTASTTGRITAVESQLGNSDLAEMYFSDQDLEPGEIVVLRDELSVRRATEDATTPILGVVSTKPGITLGFDDESTRAGEQAFPLALAGRVPVKLSTENGPINAGDALMLSSLPGVAMKSDGTGTVVGIALEDFDEDRMYSDTYINQFGDDVAQPVFTPITTNTDPRINDGCYYGGGGAAGEADCVPLSAETLDEQVAEANELEAAEAIEDALDDLRYVGSDTVLVDGRVVSVGQIVMFVERLPQIIAPDQLALFDALLSTSTLSQSGADEAETVMDRLLALADSFVAGVLSVFEIRADRVEVAEELCVDDVCVTADDLRTLLDAATAPSEEASEPPEATAPEPTDEDEETEAQDEDDDSTPVPPTEPESTATSTDPTATTTDAGAATPDETVTSSTDEVVEESPEAVTEPDSPESTADTENIPEETEVAEEETEVVEEAEVEEPEEVDEEVTLELEEEETAELLAEINTENS